MTGSERLIEVLERARQLGFLGPGEVREHYEHALGFVEFLDDARSVLDLGSGGGVPGLVVAESKPDCSVLLLDARQGRVDALGRAIGRLGLTERCRAVCRLAEDAGRDPALRFQFDAVTSRSFGPLPFTLECAAAFIRLGGRIVVSRVPGAPADEHDDLGLERVQISEGYVVYRSVAALSDSLPRRAARRRST